MGQNFVDTYTKTRVQRLLTYKSHPTPHKRYNIDEGGTANDRKDSEFNISF